MLFIERSEEVVFKIKTQPPAPVDVWPSCLQLRIAGERDARGMLIDFSELKSILLDLKSKLESIEHSSWPAAIQYMMDHLRASWSELNTDARLVGFKIHSLTEPIIWGVDDFI